MNQQSGPPIRVVVVDDEALVRGGFRAILDHQGDITVVGEAANGTDAVQVCPKTCRRCRADGSADAGHGRHPSHPPPRRTGRATGADTDHFDLDEHIYAALSAGASGFLTKDTPPERLADAVRTIARGDTLLSPSVTRRLVETYTQLPPPGTSTPQRFAALTERELDVLREIARGDTNAQIAGRLFLSEATIKTHVTRILNKLELPDRVHAVVLAYECGLVRPGQV